MALILKNFQETKTLKKIPYISGNGNPKKVSYISEMELFSPPQEKIFYTSRNGSPDKISYISSKESFSYISEKENPERIFYISGNGTFLYCRKGIFRTLVYSELTAYSENCQTFTMERFAKIATLRTFLYSWK